TRGPRPDALSRIPVLGGLPGPLCVADRVVPVAGSADELITRQLKRTQRRAPQEAPGSSGTETARPCSKTTPASSRFGVTRTNRKPATCVELVLSAASLLGLLPRIVERADVHERALRQVVALAVAQTLEGVDRVLQRRVDAGEAGEDFGDEERLAEEALDLAGAAHDQLVLFAQFINTENRDDVLQVLVALQNLLHAPGDRVVALAQHARIQDSRRRGQRID